MTEPVFDRHQRIARITLDEHSIVRRSPEVEHERRVAIFDLLEDNRFAPVGLSGGPFNVHLAIEDNRLIFHIADADDRPLERVALPVSPFRGVIKDYFTVCESYFQAIKQASPSQIEAVDMGRRSLHDEGSEMLRERLADKIAVDRDTARRLFTLLCVLHIRG